MTTPPNLPLSVAVDRALTITERAAFTGRALLGPYQGAEPADWIEDMVDQDAYLGQVEGWMNQHGDAAMAELVQYLPEVVAKSLLWRCVYVWLPLEEADLGDEPRRGPAAIAGSATMWLRGYAEGRGHQLVAEEADLVGAVARIVRDAVAARIGYDVGAVLGVTLSEQDAGSVLVHVNSGGNACAAEDALEKHGYIVTVQQQPGYGVHLLATSKGGGLR